MEMDISQMRSFIKQIDWTNLKHVYEIGKSVGNFKKYENIHDFLNRKVRNSTSKDRQSIVSQLINLIEQEGGGGSAEEGDDGEETLENMLSKIQGDADEDGAEEDYYGGGDPEDFQKNSPDKMQKVLRHFFEKLADSPGYIRTPGRKNWDVRKLIKSKFNPIVINDAKHDREKIMEIYFILDSSGSMNEYARTFAGMLKGSRDIVKCYSGMEAHPNKGENGENLNIPYNQSFATDVELWLKKVKPAPGSVFVFWGDTYGMNIRGEETRVRKMLRPYKAYWLGTEVNSRQGYGGSWEQDCLPGSGFRVITPVKDPQSLKEAIKRLK